MINTYKEPLVNTEIILLIRFLPEDQSWVFLSAGCFSCVEHVVNPRGQSGTRAENWWLWFWCSWLGFWFWWSWIGFLWEWEFNLIPLCHYNNIIMTKWNWWGHFFSKFWSLIQIPIFPQIMIFSLPIVCSLSVLFHLDMCLKLIFLVQIWILFPNLNHFSDLPKSKKSLRSWKCKGGCCA